MCIAHVCRGCLHLLASSRVLPDAIYPQKRVSQEYILQIVEDFSPVTTAIFTARAIQNLDLGEQQWPWVLGGLYGGGLQRYAAKVPASMYQSACLNRRSVRFATEARKSIAYSMEILSKDVDSIRSKERKTRVTSRCTVSVAPCHTIEVFLRVDNKPLTHADSCENMVAKRGAGAASYPVFPVGTSGRLWRTLALL